MTGIPCPQCGSTNTYCTNFYLMCRAKGHQTPLSQVPGYEQEQVQAQPPRERTRTDSMIDTLNNFGR